MRSGALAVATLAAALATLAAGASTITVDKAAHSVSFDVVSTDCGVDTEVEFLLAGPNSDHDYETMFLLADTVQELAEALAEAGFTRGTPVDYRACRFWPVGDEVKIEPDVWTLLKDERNERKAPVVFTGGTRGADGIQEAHTNMPLAVFALYDCPQSLFQFDDALSQGATYGRFRVAEKIPAGERRRLTIRLAPGEALNERVRLDLKPGKLGEALSLLKEKSAAHELDVSVAFAPEMTIAEAAQAAAALEMVDSARVKVNGYDEGQFFYRAFLPLEKWRDRKERLTQPYEVRISPGAAPRLTVIEEDWASDSQSTEPRLIIHENVPFDQAAAKTRFADTCLVFAPKNTPLKDVFALRALLPKEVANWYIYADEQ